MGGSVCFAGRREEFWSSIRDNGYSIFGPARCQIMLLEWWVKKGTVRTSPDRWRRSVRYMERQEGKVGERGRREEVGGVGEGGAVRRVGGGTREAKRSNQEREAREEENGSEAGELSREGAMAHLPQCLTSFKVPSPR